MKPYLFLLVAIVLEVIGTTSLKASEQFTRLVPTVVMAVAYVGAFFCLGMTLKTIPVGVAYAVWSGVGIVLVSLAGLLLYGQRLDGAAVAGLGLIVAGVLVIHLFSDSVAR